MVKKAKVLGGAQQAWSSAEVKLVEAQSGKPAPAEGGWLEDGWEPRKPCQESRLLDPDPVVPDLKSPVMNDVEERPLIVVKVAQSGHQRGKGRDRRGGHRGNLVPSTSQAAQDGRGHHGSLAVPSKRGKKRCSSSQRPRELRSQVVAAYDGLAQ